MLDFIRIACAVPKVKVGDTRKNAEDICAAISRADKQNVDVLVFKDKNGELKPVDGYPYAGYVGKVLKKGPERWTDVQPTVVQDYQKAREDECVAGLRVKYPVVIYEDILSTVNNH